MYPNVDVYKGYISVIINVLSQITVLLAGPGMDSLHTICGAKKPIIPPRGRSSFSQLFLMVLIPGNIHGDYTLMQVLSMLSH